MGDRPRKQKLMVRINFKKQEKTAEKLKELTKNC